MTDKLRTLAADYHRQRQAIEEPQRRLHRAIRKARADGMTLRAIAALTGLSWGRIHQLTRKL